MSSLRKPYSVAEDKFIVEVVRQRDGWQKFRGNQFWDEAVRLNQGLRRSPQSARERFLKRIINFNAHPSNRKLFTKAELDFLENTESVYDVGGPEDFSHKIYSKPQKRSAFEDECMSGSLMSNYVNPNIFSGQPKTKILETSNFTADSAVQSYKELLSIQSFQEEKGLEQGLLKSLETVAYTFEKLLQDQGLMDSSGQNEENPRKKFETLVNHANTGDILLDRLPSTLITYLK